MVEKYCISKFIDCIKKFRFLLINFWSIVFDMKIEFDWWKKYILNWDWLFKLYCNEDVKDFIFLYFCIEYIE